MFDNMTSRNNELRSESNQDREMCEGSKRMKKKAENKTLRVFEIANYNLILITEK